ncbi:MAG: hypothetical protein HOJ91_02105 [Rhodospirillaceae bacterium]|nr:hypothetical protein [Rhodospirillaceae bacterium]
MSATKTNNRETVRLGASWEKTGNTSWTQCPACDEWFHIGPGLLDRPEVKMHCPSCHHEFSQADAKRLVTSG